MHCSEVCVFWCRHNLVCASLLNTYEEPLISQCRHPKLPPLQLPPHCHDLSFGENILWKSVSVVSTFFCKGIINLPDLQVRGQSGASSGSSHRTRERESSAMPPSIGPGIWSWVPGKFMSSCHLLELSSGRVVCCCLGARCCLEQELGVGKGACPLISFILCLRDPPQVPAHSSLLDI